MHHYDYHAGTSAGRVAFELSLKPFGYDKSQAGCEAVARELFEKWKPLLRYATGCAILLWTSDGSEILEYTGDLSSEFEWGKYIGIGNYDRTAIKNPAVDVRDYNIHKFPLHYMANPPAMTYGDLKTIITALKTVGKAMTGLDIEVGETFDPGPEFAYSAFKYERHPEIATGMVSGKKMWLHCAATLHAEERAYAAYPDGIPEGTHLGEFLGRQFMAMKRDLGFDYIWLSNGFGFSLQSWNWTGELFDGDAYDFEGAAHIRESIKEFWTRFTAEIGDTRVETRGSNLSTGMDIAAHGCPIDDIYSVPNLVGPPNSPWAALDHRFGLELCGFMSHIAEIPKKGFAFRYYIHDPWWHNSPWFDRYERSPHDIYLPLAIARLDADLQVTKPYALDFLSMDDSFGQLPDRCNMEVIPHLLTAFNDSPDEAGLVTWVYPFDEYCRIGLREGHMERLMMDDWFIESAIDFGFPLNTVISDRNFIAADKAKLQGTILTMPVPEAETALEAALHEALAAGCRVILYGSTEFASDKLRNAIGVIRAAGMDGEMTITTALPLDCAEINAYGTTLQHISLISGGAVGEVALPGTEVCAEVEQKGIVRAYATAKGNLVWIRGSFPHLPSKSSKPALRDPAKEFVPSVLLRAALDKFGYRMRFSCFDISTKLPLILFSRNRQALWWNSFAKDTTVRLEMTTPDGAPAPKTMDFIIEDSLGTYPMAKALHTDCRVFVKQKARSRIRCFQENIQNYHDTDEKLVLEGLHHAEVTVYPPAGGTVCFYTTPTFGSNTPMYLGANLDWSYDAERDCYIAHDVSDLLHIGWQAPEHFGEHEDKDFLWKKD